MRKWQGRTTLEKEEAKSEIRHHRCSLCVMSTRPSLYDIICHASAMLSCIFISIRMYIYIYIYNQTYLIASAHCSSYLACQQDGRRSRPVLMFACRRFGRTALGCRQCSGAALGTKGSNISEVVKAMSARKATSSWSLALKKKLRPASPEGSQLLSYLCLFTRSCCHFSGRLRPHHFFRHILP